MIKNYFKIAIRSIMRQKVLSFINIFGLTLGLTSMLLIAVFIQYEYSFDKHFKDGEHIYRVATVLGSYNTPTSPLPLTNALREKFPDVEAVTRIFWQELTFPYFSPDEENDFQEQHAYYADQSVFDVFGLELTEGSRSNALTGANTIILSQSAARRYFGNTSALNKSVRMNNETDLKVTGVFRDIPQNTHFNADLFISSEGNQLMRDNSARNWDWLYPSFTYLKLKPAANTAKLEAALKEIFWQETGNTRQDYGADYYMYLQPLHSIHMQSHLTGELKANTNTSVIYTFGAIAFIIIVISGVNFMNLSTAQSMKRAREVGMRKVMGSQRINLVFQFLTESVSLTLIAIIAALALAFLLLPKFNELIGSDISFASLFTPVNIFVALAFALLTGVVAGSYPAFFLSGFIPSQVLKGKFSMHPGSVRLRKVLVISQFCISFIVLGGTFVISDQLNYMLSKDLGYTKENVVMIELPADSIGVERVKAEIIRLPHVVSAAKMSEAFTNVQGWFNPWYEGAPPQVDLAVTRFHTDEDFLNVMNTELVAGRFFNKEFRGDSSNYILNEAAIRKIGWTNEGAIGKKFGQEARRGQVIGVVKDFNFRHLGTPITPFVFFPPIRANRFERGRIAVRVNGDLQATLAAMEKIWSELVPEWPFKYSFVEEAVARQYQTELKLGKLTDVFSAISIFISIMGLLGLALFAISQQVKEIGIRKVLGADRNHLVIITTRDFLILVSAGIAVGIPLTYYVMYKWLQGYAYHTDLNIYSFAIAVIVSLLAALITISPVALQASSANPIDALKQE